MNTNSSLLISLSEPVNMVKQGFAEYIELVSKTNSYKLSLLNNGLNYNYVPFIEAILRDIFDDHTLINDSVGYKAGTPPPSTILLINDGLEEKYAIRLAYNVFQSIVDIIVTFVPDVNFNSDGYRFGFCGEFDLHVSKPYMDNYGQ